MKPTHLPATPDEAAARFWARFGLPIIRRVMRDPSLALPDTVEAWVDLGRRVHEALSVPTSPDRPVATLGEAAPALAVPFPASSVRLKPGAVNGARTRALGLAYVDPRAYQDRLDAVVGPDGWHTSYRRLTDRAIVCRLTILGVVREEVGEAPEGNANQYTEAVAQAFKRACAAFGLGRYLYQLPRLWFDYDPEANVIINESDAVRQLYRAAGLDAYCS